MHFSWSQTLAVVSQEPLSSVPNLPDDSAQTASDATRGQRGNCSCCSRAAGGSLTRVFVTLQGVQRLRPVQGEHADVVVVPTRGDQPSGVSVARRNDADARDEVGVSGHAVHLREASVRTGSRKKHRHKLFSNIYNIPTAPRGQPAGLLPQFDGFSSRPGRRRMNDKANLGPLAKDRRVRSATNGKTQLYGSRRTERFPSPPLTKRTCLSSRDSAR